MILKDVDDKSDILKKLKSLLKHPKIYPSKKRQIKFEIYKIERGWKNERDAAYYINTYYKDSKKVVVLHDLRLELDDISVQIDHLLMFRTDIVVFESKYFSSQLYYDWRNKSFSIKTSKGFQGIPDPIKQAERQVINFQRILEKIGLKNSVPNEYNYYVLISPTANFKSKMPDKIIKADRFIDKFREEDEKIGLIKGLSRFTRFMLYDIDKLIYVGERLKELHKPLDYSFYLRKLGLSWIEIEK